MIAIARLLGVTNSCLLQNKWVLGFVFFATTLFAANAQTLEYSGTITSSEDGSPLPGASVMVKGTSIGTSTDFDGNYTISAEKGAILVYSYVGFQNTEITAGDQTTLNVALKIDATALDDVVVIGYGTQRKSDLTGAVAVVDADEAKKTVTYDVAKMLQGQAPGVTVQSSGEPGGFVSINIRGLTSFTNNNPLFVVDGVIVDDPFDFAPGEIESMQVLKDASSAAIYGVRGANGVVIITTKKGKAGELRVRYKSLVGFESVPKKLSLTNRSQYQEVVRTAEQNAIDRGYSIAIATGNYPESADYINDVDTDWQDEFYETGIQQNHSLTLSGGAEAMTYSLNLDYFKDSGYFVTPQMYERLSTNLNLTGSKGKFKYGAKLAYTKSDKEIFNEYLAGTSSVADLLGAIPTMPVYDDNWLGGYGGSYQATQRAITLNVIGFNNLIENNTRRNRFLGNIWGEYEILKGLSYRLSVSGDQLSYFDKYFNPPSELGWYYINTPEEALLNLNSGYETQTLVNNLLTYKTTFKEKHNLDVLAGWIQQKNYRKNNFSNGTGFDYGEISHIEYADDFAASEFEETVTTSSLLSRVNYSYDDRYFLTANFRQDKSSLFAEQNNTGSYFSFSGAWKIHNDFTLPEWWNVFKVRGGYGQLGNNTVGSYAYSPTVNPFASYLFFNTSTGQTELANGTTVVTLLDPDIKWEDTETTNIAAEFEFFNNKLKLTTEYFQKKSTDLLAQVPLPYSTGSVPASITTNAAAVKNDGVEFILSYSDASSEDFSYNITANAATVNNEVLSIGADNTPIYGAASKTEVGRSVGELFGYQMEGIFQDANDVASSPFQQNASPGDVKFRDVNGDGQITDDDRVFLGRSIPKITYGFNFSSQYKNWDFSFFWQGAAGHSAFNASYRNLMIGQYTNHHTDIMNYWTPDNTNTNIPAPVIGDPNANSRDSDRFVEDASYIRLQNIQLGYTIPMKETAALSNARVYVSGQNVVTLSGYKGYDPDFKGAGIFSKGYDLGSFPNPRTFYLGVEVAF
ncbi:TonB-linked outer membrane protein, SusC/RagA family [Pustulibacterium marinum]|uniref:TonB-linked outer membrane protein, SusC/RagA family n=1 Tax=Pustulibacterium marinum TaxID=1224947 RepID=A0A1I7HIG4_9FLAO|nr:TonB-dependent receptor [Pustulibacterium marinum]SFU60564.1 TonB-linked outer membrane protein, SusC/RagA family [Pustulibacterium marinum]